MARKLLTPEERLTYQREYYRKWRIVNRHKVNEAAAKWRRANPSKRRNAVAAWKKENYARVLYLNAKRQASKLQRTVSWSNPQKIAEKYEEAVRLSKETGTPHHVDHIIPLQGELVSGLHVENNLQILTAIDNMTKGNKFEETNWN